MNDYLHTVLCVDDEQNVLNSLKRLLRKEKYRLLTARSGNEGLQVLIENDVHLVMSDQRMPEMSGTEFLARVREKHPDTMRIVLTGYTDVDSITESINHGHIYKFFLKPWNDHNLILEIRQALDQYELIRANRRLNEKVRTQCEELRRVNENLESMVRQRTRTLEIQNQALELSHAVLEHLPIPIIGVGADGMVVLINRKTQEIRYRGKEIAVGSGIEDWMGSDVSLKVQEALSSESGRAIEGIEASDHAYHVELTPLRGKFRGQGVIVTLTEKDSMRHPSKTCGKS
jgi:FixJ family two-component response regulator